MSNLLEFSKRVVDIAVCREKELTSDRIFDLSVIFGLTSKQSKLYIRLSVEAVEELGEEYDVDYLPFMVANSIDKKLKVIAG